VSCTLLPLLTGHFVTNVALAENIALGKPYEWSTPPRYGQCMDKGDRTQLTDGTSDCANWTDKATVGWVHQGRVTVTIDLGKAQPIGHVAFVAAGGGHADVFFPAVTAVLTSRDGQRWHFGAAIGSGGLVQDRSRAYGHRFQTAELKTPARYVRLVFQAEERYLFLDEIEVFATATPVATPTDQPLGDDQLDELLATCLRARWVAAEWPGFREQALALASRATAAAPPDIATRLKDFDARVLAVDVADPDAVETLRTAYTRMRAEAARTVYADRVHVQRVYPWAAYRGQTFPLAEPALPAAIDLLAWQDEYESVAWTATNLTGKSARVRIRVSPLCDEWGVAHCWADRLWLRCGMAIPTRVGNRVVDALPLLSAGDQPAAEVRIGAGEYRLLWMTVCAKDLPAGKYQADVCVEASPSGQKLLESALTLNVASLRMPPADERTLAAYAWEEYLAAWKQQGPQAVDDLRAHGVNTFILHPSELPRPKFDSERTRLESVDFEAMDAALALRKWPRMHGIFWGGPFSCWGLDLQNPGHAKLFKQFIQAWADHLKQKGIEPGEFFFYPLDEELSERMIRLAKLIKEADAEFQVYCNKVTTPDAKPELMRRLAPYVDIAGPLIFTLADHENVSRQESAFCEIQEKHDLKVWTYACSGPGRLKAPDTYYRNLSWETFRRGGAGTGFWCYYGGNAWDAYKGGLYYGVVYAAKDAPPGVTRAEAIIPSRRWEAFREGTEDFEYLHQAQRAIAAAWDSGIERAACDRAAALVTEAVSDVLNAPDDPNRYQRARGALTKIILDLREKKEAGALLQRR
jgi:hypothetical protein